MGDDDRDHGDLDHTALDHTALDHTEIERDNWIERYALGRLSVDEQIRFEEHFAECEQCVTELEMAQDFDATLRTVVAEDTQRAVGMAAAAAYWLRRPRVGWLVAGLLLVALLPSLWLYSGQRQLRDQLERLGSPQGTIPGFELTLDRGVESPPRTIQPSGDSPWFAVVLEVEESDVASYSVTLTDSEGKTLWRSEGLAADPWGLLRLTLPTDFLEAGAYDLEIELREGSGPYEPYGRIPFLYDPP